MEDKFAFCYVRIYPSANNQAELITSALGLRFFFIFKHAVPDGPPIEARVTHVKPTILSLSWLPPEPELRNGKIINYTICIRVFSTSSPGPCLREALLGNQTHYTATELKPYTKYTIIISAGTEIGFGPPVLVVNSTLQAGKYNKWKLGCFAEQHAPDIGKPAVNMVRKINYFQLFKRHLLD